MTEARAVRPGRKRLLLAALIVAGGLLTLEAAVRLRQWALYGRSGSFYEFAQDEASGLRVPKPGVTRGRDHVIEINSLGFRGPELACPKPPGRVRVAFLGGSTTFCAEASCNATTWPALVCAGLGALFPGREFDYVNAGAAAFTTKDSLRNLQWRVVPTEPDILVIYEATNDLSHDSRDLAQRQGLAGGDRPGTSWLAQRSTAWELIEKNLMAPRPAADTGGPTLRFDPDELAAPFRENLRALVREAQRCARTAVLVTFAHRQRREQPHAVRRASSATSLHWMPYMSVDGVLDGFEAFNRVIRAVAAEAGALLVEGEHDIPGDAEHFADSVHFTDAGCRRQADRVLAALAAAPQLDWLRP